MAAQARAAGGLLLPARVRGLGAGTRLRFYCLVRTAPMAHSGPDPVREAPLRAVAWLRVQPGCPTCQFQGRPGAVCRFFATERCFRASVAARLQRGPRRPWRPGRANVTHCVNSLPSAPAPVRALAHALARRSRRRTPPGETALVDNDGGLCQLSMLSHVAGVRRSLCSDDAEKDARCSARSKADSSSSS